MQACDIIAAVRRRHPANRPPMPGEWTVPQGEMWNCDVMAIRGWGDGRRVGYEVKVSRGDMRRELLRPDKRQTTFRYCHEAYFAVPAGLLTKEELSYKEPKWGIGDFERETCPGMGSWGTPTKWQPHARARGDGRYVARCVKGVDYVDGRRVRERLTHATVPVPVVLADDGHYPFSKTHGGFRDAAGRPLTDHDWDMVVSRQGFARVVCCTCGGKGHLATSRVEREAPTLWVPQDMGLLEVYPNGHTRTVRRAPGRIPERLTDYMIGRLVRHVSMRPDPRHVAS